MATPNQGELDVVLDSFPRLAQRSRSHNDPLMPFETNLRLTKVQEERLVLHVLKRFGDLNNETGRHEANINSEARLTGALSALHAQGISTKSTPWMLRRAIFYRHFYNNYDERVSDGTIYKQSNLTASLSPRITMQVSGKLKDALYGADPWFSASPVGEGDEELARRTREFTRYKAAQAGLLDAQKEALDLACILGESVIKTTFVDERLWYWRKSPILVNAKGEPRYDSKGNYIFMEDRFVPEMAEQQPDPNMPPEMAPTGRSVLRKDNTVVLEEGDVWEERRVRVGDIQYKGARSKAIFFTDFLCPLTASCVHDADIVIHAYDKPAMEVASWFLQGRFSHMSTQGQVEVKARDAMAMLADLAATAFTHINTGSLMQPRDVHGETDDMHAPGSSGLINVLEAWVRFDADEDGFQEDIIIMVDPKTMLPLYYEYTGMATDDRRRPFTVQRILPVYGRWYGQGMMEYLEPEQLFIDLLVNRWNVTLSNAGQIVLWDPKKTVEGQTQKDLILNAGKTYRKHGDAKAEDIIEVVEIYAKNRAADLQGMLQFFMQLMQLKTGVISVADESISTMESTKLATGIRSIEKAGDLMFTSWLSETAGCATRAVEKFTTVTLMRMDERETWEFTEGENSVMVSLSREDVLGLRMNVQIMLANDEGERVIASTMGFFSVLDRLLAISLQSPDTAQAAVPVAVAAARALKIPNPEDVIVLPAPPPMMPMGMEPPTGTPVGGAGAGGPARQAQPAAGGARAQGQPNEMALMAVPDLI